LETDEEWEIERMKQQAILEKERVSANTDFSLLNKAVGGDFTAYYVICHRLIKIFNFCLTTSKLFYALFHGWKFAHQMPSHSQEILSFIQVNKTKLAGIRSFKSQLILR
jgi:hypothetical protein